MLKCTSPPKEIGTNIYIVSSITPKEVKAEQMVAPFEKDPMRDIVYSHKNVIYKPDEKPPLRFIHKLASPCDD